MKVNLHTHSTISDGRLSPKDLVEKLHQDGVKIFALTDHDKLDGINEAKEQAAEYEMKLITGIEISTRIFDLGISFLDEKIHTIHMLALNFNYETLKQSYQDIDKNKANKLGELNEQLIDLGYQIPRFVNLTRRVTIANALVTHGYAKSEEQAFEEIINKHYDRWSDNLGVKDVVRMVHNAGGKLLWAHPYEILENVSKCTLNESQIEEIARKLKLLGVDGIEVYYQKYKPEQIDFLKDIQKKYDFICSCGTDYHARDSQPITFVDIDLNLIKAVIS